MLSDARLPSDLPPEIELKKLAREVRKIFLSMHFEAQSGHVGSGLSAIDIMVYAYWSWLGDQDQFILSKGHAASALYAVLSRRGLLEQGLLETYYKDGTTLPAHPKPLAHKAIPFAGGSLGHGLPVATGIAFAKNSLAGQSGRVLCLMSDGECNEGSTWEAALFAQHHRLSNLTVVIDLNGLQGFGRTQDILCMDPLPAKWQAFGFETLEVDGHDFSSLRQAFASESERPRCIICRTIKGKGIPAIENMLSSHYLPLTDEQYQSAIAELEAYES